MIDKNFMDIILNAQGGDFSTELFERIEAAHNTGFDESLQPFLDYMQETLPKAEYCDMISYLSTNYTVYAEEGYKTGFNDDIRFLVSVLADKSNI